MNTPKNALREITEDADYAVTLSDGTRLSARVWKPADAGDDPVPAILEFLPYRKRDGTCARDALTHPYFAKRGYACLRVDMRGNGDSHGLMEDEYSQQELDDAVEVINHFAAQDWCNGSVGMMGISWGGFNSLQVAAMTPPALKAIITLCSTVDRFADDIHYKGGCLLNENLGWGATMWSYSSRAPDPALRPDWREMWMDRLENEPFLPSKWLRHQTRDDYWKHGSVCESYDKIKAKVLAVGGWGDAYKNAVPQIVDNIPGAKGIVGPWVHKYPHFAVPEPRIGFLQEALRWWDKWLKGIETGVEDDPDYRAYIMDGVRPQTWYTDRIGHWVGMETGTTDRPPSEDKTWHHWHFEADKLQHTPQNSKGDLLVDTPISSPQDCGADAGEYCAIWLGPEMPGDQRRDDSKGGTWTSEPLDAPLEILGAAQVGLAFQMDEPRGQLAVRLNHVHPDGAKTRITYGVLNLENAGADQVYADPDTPAPKNFRVNIKLDHIGYTVPAGHRICISVSTAYWPLIWPAAQKFPLTITGGILAAPLPIPAKGVTPFAPPEAEAPWQTETIREGANSRKQETDLNTGFVHLRIVDDFGKIRDLDHGLINGSIARETWSIHPDDPLSARGACHWSDEIERDDIRLRTETRCEMWSDVENFYLSAKLEAYENDALIYEREITDQIARNGI
ncbi:CocE/NonD family hydrolase [Pseudosulfitobacter sp. SM2401]|uniref:CocE/NonD family hydrolase n=1 Tax=Pseudosulfitobacter sp. SM2401 TaxID=3350098 RepID=UPI0036F32AC0